jgi:hypothetical protein
MRMLRAELDALRWQLETAKAERDVWSGEACKQEQANGKGPCGACRHCLPAAVEALGWELNSARLNLAEAGAELDALTAELARVRAALEGVRDTWRKEVTATQEDAITGTHEWWRCRVLIECADELSALLASPGGTGTETEQVKKEQT